MESIGICLGASTITLVRLRKTAQGVETLWTRSQPHEGNPRQSLSRMFSKVDDFTEIRIAATGRKFREHLTLATISEPEAVELAYGHLLSAEHQCRIIVSAGGETFLVYHLDEDGKIQNIHTGNKCASGTGEFFLQQLGRMGLNLAEVAEMKTVDNIYKLSGRCSVFCKSDCTHALNKGESKDRVVAGLTHMMAAKIVELLKTLPPEPVMLTGGCTHNKTMVHYLRQEIDDVYIPEAAPYFEALGVALWALEHEEAVCPDLEHVFDGKATTLSFLKPLEQFQNQVHFKEHSRGTANPHDQVILGLDVGSTTTKGVLMRRHDKAILADDYLRTDGDPVCASRRVYQSLAKQLKVPVTIEGLGVTGSGRQIAGLHGMTGGVINEIIAHATAAVYFDPEVDTIFEIGGQDAKYTYLTNGVPCDYAMNEACSAGTGSFLEEAAQESLGISVTDIGDTAYQGTNPPNFNDQCAAFISSDIKSASQQGVPLPDIVAGLVYSIGMNYTNRVKGNRPVGKKVFIQGGVCYNKAVPAAMAALTGKEMIVPPDPGLMGAFGVALEVHQRIEQGVMSADNFILDELSKREVKYGKPFTCRGGKECDRNCEIVRIEIGDKVYPFGGTCNRYDNLIHKRKIDTTGLNLAVLRERRVFRDLASGENDARPTVGMNRSFLLHTWFPFFNRFFRELGYRLIVSDTIDSRGVERQTAAFCYPVEQAHGYVANLLQKKPDFIFMPHLKGIPSGTDSKSCTCVFVQAEPFYLKAAFPELDTPKTVTPTLDFSENIHSNLSAFKEAVKQMGGKVKLVKTALNKAWEAQQEFFSDIKKIGKDALNSLDADPAQTAVVLFGRPYNSFADAANKGIPAKFASRNLRIIPFDMLPYEECELAPEHNMYWGMGRMILKGAHYVEKHPQLCGVYITNFSCGPDSFVVGYFRNIMDRKPSLTLELDSHTADAGIETRIEAFLDIVNNYRRTVVTQTVESKITDFRSAVIELEQGKSGIKTSSGQWLPLASDLVKVAIPAMGKFGTPLLAKAFQRENINAEVLPPADDEVLKLGRGNSSCKECLPLQTTVGAMLKYLEERAANEVTAFFMPSAEGPCRFGQYHVFAQNVINKQKINDAAVLTLSSNTGYGGLDESFMLAAWRAIVIGDIFDEIYSTILAGATDRQQGLAIFEAEYQKILKVIHKKWNLLSEQLAATAKILATIPLKQPYEKIPKLSLIGEIYVRHDPISLQNLIENMADRGFIVRTAPNSEWFKYVDWLIKEGIEGEKSVKFMIRMKVKSYFDKKIRTILAASGLFFSEHAADIEPIIAAGEKFISPNLSGETILTVGSALHEILHPSCGIISIGPFGCMPTRVAESILNQKFNFTEKRHLTKANGHHNEWEHILVGERKLPFLAIETDGKAFPQIIEARLEALCLQAGRLNEMMVA